MSNKSGIAEQVITLAKGGGELKGLGETFSPDLHTGTGNFSVPIALPEGRNGFQPELGIAYSSGNGNTCFGLGWQLSIPGVSRKTSKGIPRYQGNDTFLLSGVEDLVPVGKGEKENGISWTQYRPRTEGLFAIIRRYVGNGKDYWEVKGKDGLVSYYGQSPFIEESNSATVFDPTSPRKIFSWQLVETRDIFGNRIIYEYEREQIDDGVRNWNQLYLKRIKYLDYLDENNQEQYLVSVEFKYEGNRPDPFSVYTSGFEVRTTRLCHKIATYTHPSPNEKILVKTFNFEYETAKWTKTSLLKSISVKGHDGEEEESLPPLTFAYTVFDPKGQKMKPVSGEAFPTQSLAHEETELVDLFGNGLPDIVQMNGVIRYWKNKGNGQFELPRVMTQAPAGVSLSNPGVHFMDANGEGKADLVVQTNDFSGYFPTTFEGKWDERSFKKYKEAPSFRLQDPEVKLVDLNGDGITDALRSGTHLECYFNDPEKGWHELVIAKRKDLDVFPNVNLSDPRVRLADMTGDSLQDIVLIHGRSVEYWPYMGYGKWGKRVQMKNAPKLPKHYDPKRLLLGDIAGDGPHDLIYIDHCEVKIWINQNGNGFSDPIMIEGTPLITDVDAVRLMDLNGTGTSGILWSADQRLSGRDHYFFLDLTNEIKPYVLNEMNNHMGAITKVKYKPSTFYYLQDEANRATRWKTNLPFPVQVVACVEVVDEISKSKLVTEYRYRHGYWDGAEREFRGFGRVEQTDTQAFEVYKAYGLHGEEQDFEEVIAEHYTPPTKSITWFHQGPVGEGEGDWTVCDYSNEYWQGDEGKLDIFSDLEDFLQNLGTRRERRDALRTLRGSVLRKELYSLDDPNIPWTVSESVYEVRKEGASQIPLKGMSGAIFYPMAVAQRSTNWERGNDPKTSFSFTEDYDDYGQARKTMSIACPRGWKKLEDVIPETTPFLSTAGEVELAYSTGETPYLKGLGTKSSSYEITHQGEQTLVDIKLAARDNNRKKLIAQSINYYDGDAFEGKEYGKIGEYGVAVRSESLVITEAILKDVWKNPDGTEADLPPYISLDGEIWPEEYPDAFKGTVPDLAGYTFYDGRDEHARGYWAETSSKFDFHDESEGFARGLPLILKDALGREASTEYDTYYFLPIKSTNPIGLSVTAENDYRLFQPYLSTDPNDNVSMVKFSPLGFVVATYILGKEGKEEGDGLDRNDTNALPSSKNEYDFLAWMDHREPIWVKSMVREHHKYDVGVSPTQKDDTITSIQFSDGFGRIIQTRTQAEDVLFTTEDDLWGNELLPETQGDDATTTSRVGIARQADDPMNVIVSGWQRYDNKGQQVVQYEPFYAKGFAFGDQEDAQKGQKVEQFYDPLGRVVCSRNPDGSEQMVVFGIPVAFRESQTSGRINSPVRAARTGEFIRQPINYSPSPWEAYTYDANDNAKRTKHEDRVNNNHWNTPSSIEVDALGRTIKATARNGQAEEDEIITLSTYDIRGNLLTVTDALGRLAFKHFYDLSFDEENGSQVWRTENIDAGISKSIINVLGLPVESRDSKDCLQLQAYDELNRPTRLWARDKAAFSMTLRQNIVYSDTGYRNMEPGRIEVLKQANRLRTILYHYDESGRLATSQFDFKGNLLLSEQHTIKTKHLIPLMGKAEVEHFQIDWAGANVGEILEDKGYLITTTYDALNRPKQINYPRDVEGKRKAIRPAYNRAGALESIEMVGSDVGVLHIAYNARGQRTLIAYKNGLMTRYAYDNERFWLKRLRTEKYDQQVAQNFVFTPSGNVLQDYAYEYDLIGNITKISHRQANAGVPNSTLGQHVLDRTFTYDPIYRLLSATGREHSSRMPQHDEPWLQAMIHTNQDATATRTYSRSYTYDKVGNMLQLKHHTQDGTANFKRIFTHKSENNQLESYDQGNVPKSLIYDINGNLTQEGASRHYYWNPTNQLHAFRIQANTSVSVEARYLYDASGERVKKVVRKGNTIQTTTYIGGIFEYHTEETLTGEVQKANNTLQLMDDQSRIALIRVGNTFDANDNSPAIQYQLGDHLGNVDCVVNEHGLLHSREEHYPYGGTSFGCHAKKRYRFTGKERDEESGLNYHSARYYAPWMCKWVSADPAGMVDGVNLYGYVRGNPIILYDSSGMDSKPIKEVLPGLITDYPGLGQLWDEAANSVLEKRFGKGSLHANKAEYKKKLRSFASDKERGKYARKTFDSIRRGFYKRIGKRYLKIAKEGGKAIIPGVKVSKPRAAIMKSTGRVPVKGAQIDHAIGELAKSPENALDAKNLGIKHGHATKPGGSHHAATQARARATARYGDGWIKKAPNVLGEASKVVGKVAGRATIVYSGVMIVKKLFQGDLEGAGEEALDITVLYPALEHTTQKAQKPARAIYQKSKRLRMPESISKTAGGIRLGAGMIKVAVPHLGIGMDEFYGRIK